MPDRRVLGMPADLYRSYHHLAGVNPDPRLDGNPAIRAHALGVTTQLLLHRQRRMKCALRMVLVRDGRAEDCEDAVTFGRQRRLKFVKQPRFTSACVGDYRNDLPMPALRQLQRVHHLP
jgi:hypothetical protein